MAHPSTVSLLRYFEHDHLDPRLADVSAPFATLAQNLCDDPGLSGPELMVALRKLLEAKDCAVRAALPPI